MCILPIAILAPMWYYTIVPRGKPQIWGQGESFMTIEYFELHAAEWEAEQAYWEELEALAQKNLASVAFEIRR